MYDEFSTDYDDFVNWEERLSAELPFIEKLLQAQPSNGSSPLHVLDAACGTGRHAIALAQRGYRVTGADLSLSMIQRARQNASTMGIPVHFATAGFGELETVFGQESFDALLCLGNSLPHLLNESELSAALRDFATCLRPKGLLLVQNRNFDAVLEKRQRWMEPQTYRDEQWEKLFLRFYDFEPQDLITFNILIVKRELDHPWVQQVISTRLRPIVQVELASACLAAGFENLQAYGSMNGEAFDVNQSPNLVLTARKGTGL